MGMTTTHLVQTFVLKRKRLGPGERILVPNSTAP
ncbi:hypothetical protein MPOCJGCO_3731 [Methylobacterium trifolii]|uniref:Uncharacterized protein n=1 Tax=Methylobacterium trifolii TaxID=1003092 RepID=A0ABQ4U402_9HYPH|nr:hypothetical protein MPOCJGCO_3731 [Methylobacterium trifolii]